MNEQNPYESPRSDVDGAPAAGGTGHTATIAEHLRRTRPWVVFVAILGLVFAGLLALSGIIMAIVGVAESGGYGGEEQMIAMFAMGFGYILIAAVYVLLAILLMSYGKRIGLLVQTNETGYAEQALDAQRRFWKTFGIITIIFIGITLLGSMIVVFAAAASGGF